MKGRHAGRDSLRRGSGGLRMFVVSFVSILVQIFPFSHNLAIPLFSEIAIFMINNGNRTEWSPIRSVIIRVINKIGRPRSGIRFVNQEYDYRPNWTARCPVTN